MCDKIVFTEQKYLNIYFTQGPPKVLLSSQKYKVENNEVVFFFFIDVYNYNFNENRKKSRYFT